MSEDARRGREVESGVFTGFVSGRDSDVRTMSGGSTFTPTIRGEAARASDTREQFREQEIVSRRVGVTTVEAREKLKADQARIAASTKAATEEFQATTTPLEERVREIRLERPRTPGGGRDPGQEEAEAIARAELAEQGFEEEQVETPFGELGGTEETGFLPPNTIGGRDPDTGGTVVDITDEGDLIVALPGGGEVVKPAPGAGAVDTVRQVPRLGPGRGGNALGGALAFGALLSFALAVRKKPIREG